MSETSPVFRPPKSRRLVSAWMLRDDAQHALARVTEFQDIFDQVILMCEHPGPDGSLPADWPASERAELIAKFRDLGVSVLNDYSGDGELFAELCESKGALARLIANMAAECEDTGADGVDIDLEHLPARARFAFTGFIADLAAALHERGKMLSICTDAPSAASRRDGGIRFLELPTLAHYADHLRPMNYDLFGPWTPEVVGPTSTAPWTRERMSYLAREVPRHKLVMGLPTYSLDFDLTEPPRSRQVYDFEWVDARAAESSIGRRWISHWDVSVARYTDAEGHLHLLYITDARSTRSHLETADALDVAGVCFWCLRGDDPAIWECVRRHFGRS